MDLMSLLAGAGNVPLPGLGGGPLPGMGGGVPIEDMSGQAPSLPLPPSMPVAQALAGRPQNPMIAQLLALAGQGGAQQQPTGIPIQALRMMLFQQLNQQPAKGPFTAIVNPIVAALTARQLAPYYQQQQEAAQAKQRLDNLQSAAAITSSLATAGVNQGKADELQRNKEWWDSLTDEQKATVQGIKNKTIADANAQLRDKTTQAGWQVRKDIAQGGWDAAAARTKATIDAANKRHDETMAEKKLSRENLQAYRDQLITQRDWEEIGRQQRSDASIASRQTEGERNREARRQEAIKDRKAAWERSINQMDFQAVLQAQRLNAAMDSETSEHAQLKDDLDLYGKLAARDPGRADDFFQKTIIPQYESIYKDKFNLGAPGFVDYLRNWSIKTPEGYTPPSVASKLPQGTPPKSPTETPARAPYQPVPVPRRGGPTSGEEQANQIPDTSNDPMGNLLKTSKKRKFTLGQ